MECIATCPKGFEKLLALELKELHCTQIRPLTGQVSFGAELADAYRACMWSRLASRVLVMLARVGAANADELYQQIFDISWETHIPVDASIAVQAHGTNAELRNTQFIALRTKDAIVDRMLAKKAVRITTNPSDPDIRLVVRLHNNTAMVGLDISGEPLFKRGYELQDTRRRNKLGFLRPDYACALLAQAGWIDACQSATSDDTVPSLVVLYPGEGTLVCEATSIALGRAAGLLHARWGFDKWLLHDQACWKRIYNDAQQRAQRVQQTTEQPQQATQQTAPNKQFSIMAIDTREGWQTSVRHMLRSAGMFYEPTLMSAENFKEMTEVTTAAPAATTSSTAAASTLPQQRLADQSICVADLSFLQNAKPAVEATMFSEFRALVPQLSTARTLGIIDPTNTTSDILQVQPLSTINILLGQTPSVLSCYNPADIQLHVPHITYKDGQQLPVFMQNSEQFAARLAKNYRLRKKWASRELISCYRVYDADLPDYAAAIDLYETLPQQPRRGIGSSKHPNSRASSRPSARPNNQPERWAVIAEYAAPKMINPAHAWQRLLDMLTITARICDIQPEHIFVKTRMRSKGGSQYAQTAGTQGAGARGARPITRLVDENGLLFEVNFDAALDTGLFLDHRDTRNMLRELAKKVPYNGYFCNLFSYTGSASCYVADGGVTNTVTVDMSKTYLDWAQRNMRCNGFADESHKFVQADVLKWVDEQRHSPNRYHLIFCDVPTFSNSSRMRKRGWDVQRDHAELLISLSRMLAKDGVCVFSCNLRSFKLDEKALQKAGVSVEDISSDTIPEDFKRNPKIHRCFLVRRA